MTTSTAQVSLSGKISFKNKTFTIKDGIEHIVANNDTISLLTRDYAGEVFPLWKESGELLLSMKAFVGGSKKDFGKWVSTTELSEIDPSDRYCMMLIASEWKMVKDLMESGELFKKNGDPLGLSSVQKILAEKKNPKDAKASKGKDAKASKKEEDAKASEAKEPQNEAELAELVNHIIKSRGFDVSVFTKKLASLQKKA